MKFKINEVISQVEKFLHEMKRYHEQHYHWQSVEPKYPKFTIMELEKLEKKNPALYERLHPYGTTAIRESVKPRKRPPERYISYLVPKYKKLGQYKPSEDTSSYKQRQRVANPNNNTKAIGSNWKLNNYALKYYLESVTGIKKKNNLKKNGSVPSWVPFSVLHNTFKEKYPASVAFLEIHMRPHLKYFGFPVRLIMGFTKYKKLLNELQQLQLDNVIKKVVNHKYVLSKKYNYSGWIKP